MTDEQWNKVFQEALFRVNGDPFDPKIFEEIKSLTLPVDEAQLDTDIADRETANKQARIAELEQELADLKANG